MVGSEIYGIAARNGWSVSMSMKNGVRCYDFQRKTGCFVGNQIGSTKGCLDFIWRPYEWQGLRGMIDISIDGTAVNAEVSCRLTYRISLFRDYSCEIFVYHSCFSIKVGRLWGWYKTLNIRICCNSLDYVRILWIRLNFSSVCYGQRIREQCF